jgi:WD40 repeat protein
LSFSLDGRSLAVGAGDGTASVWDLQARKRLGNPFGPYDVNAPAVFFELDGRLLILPSSLL